MKEVNMKLLIVDDEDYTREGLVESLPWKEYGIEEIMQARDGRAGLSIAKWFKPDIVLSDIKMPKLNGIEFAKEVNAIKPQIKIIFMSGYMEIDYLKSAIQLSAVDYIEKPIELAALKHAVHKAIDDIKAKLQAQMLTADKQELQQQKLVNTLVCKDNDKETIFKLCQEVGFPTEKIYLCLIIQCKKSEASPEEVQKHILSLLRKTYLKTLCNYMGEGQYCVVIAFKKNDYHRLPELYKVLVSKIPDIILGIGFESSDIMSIYNSYQTARLAINCSFYEENEKIFMLDEEILNKQVMDPGIYGEFMRRLTEEPDSLKSWCETLFKDLKKQKYYQKEKIQTLLTSFVTSMIDRCPALMDSIEGISSPKEVEQTINHFSTLTEIQQYIRTLIKAMDSIQETQSKYSKMIRDVMEYITKHYGESDLSIAHIAECFRFSPTYLNVLFKQETHVTLKQYLSDYRLEKAKKMLTKDYFKIAEIAELCGYTNGNYFAKVFKEETKLTPYEYRKKCLE
jgi:two-component system response regulator YesN